MDLNTALETDSVAGSQILLELDAITIQLAALGSRYPNTFEYLSETAKGTGEMNLQDAAAAIGWVLDHLAEGE